MITNMTILQPMIIMREKAVVIDCTVKPRIKVLNTGVESIFYLQSASLVIAIESYPDAKSKS